MTAIAFPITSSCEENCEFCFRKQQEDISLEKFKALLAEALEQDRTINKVIITGGNPELNPDFFAICNEVKKHGLLLKVHSNYSNCNTWGEYLKLADELSIPLDSLAGNDFRSHQSTRNFSAALKFFLGKVTIQVHTVVSQKNIHELQAIKAFLDDLHFFPNNSWKIFRLIANDDLSTYRISDKEWAQIIKTYTQKQIFFVDDVSSY